MNNIPKAWEGVFVDQFISLMELDKEMPFYQKNLEMLAILTDTLSTDEEWEDMSITELNGMLKEIKWLSGLPSDNFSKKLFEYEIIDINKLTFGEFIDLDYFFAENYYTNLTKIAAVLYKKTKVDEWGNIVYEPYGKYSLESRAKQFEELKITEIYGILKYYLDFKRELASIYELLFEPDFSHLEDEEDEEMYEEDEKDLIRQEEMNKKWSWESVLYKLSNGDISKYDAITEMPVIFIFNQMSFIRDMKYNT